MAGIDNKATLQAWSYSVYVQYTKCPRSVFYEKIKRLKIQEPPNEHFDKGNMVHETAAKFVTVRKGREPKLPKELKQVEERLKELRTHPKVSCELEWAFTRKYDHVGWFDREAWLRIKVDVISISKKAIEIVDWKTGKVHSEHAQQRSLYALGGLQLVLLKKLESDKDVVLTAAHVYTDTGQTATEQFTLKELPVLKREWAARTKEMLSDTGFKPKPGYHCKWCKFAKSRGGPCADEQR